MDKKYDGVIEMRFYRAMAARSHRNYIIREIHVFPRLYRRPKINCLTIS